MTIVLSLLKTLLARFAEWPRGVKRAIMVILDLAVFVISVWLALYLRLGTWFVDWKGQAAPLLMVGGALAFSLMWYCGVYRAIFRFVGAGMMATLFRAYLLYALAMAVVFVFVSIPGVPRTAGVIQPLVFFAMVVGLRTISGLLLLELLGRRLTLGESKIALVYGAGEAGQQLVHSLASERDIQIVGYLDDDRRLVGQKLDRLRVFDAARLDEALAETGATTVLLALPTLGRPERRAIVERLSQHQVEVLAIPRMGELIGGRISYSDVRPVEIEDLLGREPVAPNRVLLARTILGKRVMVTGAGGSIGSELCRQIVELRPAVLILADMSEHALYLIEREIAELRDLNALPIEIVTELINIADGPSASRLFQRYRPHTVFHAAAYKHVPIVEANAIGGMRNNIVGTLNCAVAARENGVDHFILISTDKAVRPTNVMGASKRVCELILQAFAAEKCATRFAMVRFGNVLGSSGSVVPQFLAQIRSGGPVTLTHRDITRFFMTIPEAAQLVIQAGAMAQGGEVYLLDMGEPVRIHDLARKIIGLSGLTVRDEDSPAGDIEIVEVGLRPGEKLYEELLIEAHSLPTKHPRILTARENMIPLEELMPVLDDLQRCFLAGDRAGAIALLSGLVPEYTGGSAARAEAVAG